jgi:hypothetical protein
MAMIVGAALGWAMVFVLPFWLAAHNHAYWWIAVIALFVQWVSGGFRLRGHPRYDILADAARSGTLLKTTFYIFGLPYVWLILIMSIAFVAGIWLHWRFL